LWPDANRTYAIRAIAEKKTKIVFLVDMRAAGLLFAEPSFRTEPFKKWVQSTRPFVLPLSDRKRAGDLSLPIWRVDKAASPVGRLFERASGSIFKVNVCLPKFHNKTMISSKLRGGSHFPNSKDIYTFVPQVPHAMKP
jgi:hypothetical protein